MTKKTMTLPGHAKDAPKYWMSEREIYMLKFNPYNSAQIGYAEGFKTDIELYSSLKEAEERIMWLLRHKENFRGLSFSEAGCIEREDWGIMYHAIAPNDPTYKKVAHFTVKFELLHEKAKKY